MTIVFKVESMTDQVAVLKDADNNLVNWPKSKLPADVAPGAEVFFHVYPQKDLINHEKKLAEEILNEILNIPS